MDDKEAPFKDDSKESYTKEVLEDEGYSKSFRNHREAMKEHKMFKELSKFDRKLIRGFMRGSGFILMLWLINRKGQHGYEIMTQIHDASPFHGNMKMPSPSIIYPKLHQMERKGLIKGTWEIHGNREVKYYEITPEGVETLSRIRNLFKNRGNTLYEEFVEDMLSLNKR